MDSGQELAASVVCMYFCYAFGMQLSLSTCAKVYSLLCVCVFYIVPHALAATYLVYMSISVYPLMPGSTYIYLEMGILYCTYGG